MAKTKKPSGLTITRKGNKYTFKWKKGETYGDGQRLAWSYTTAGKKSTYAHHPQGTIKLGSGTTSKTVTITANKLLYVGFEVWGKADNKEWSAHTSKDIAIKPPVAPTVTANWESETPNRTIFSYTAKDEDQRPYDHCIYQTILLPNCPDNYKVETLWSSAPKNNLNGKSGTFQTGAESGLTGTNTRIVRVKAIGQGGASEWRYAYHVYAQPNAPTDVQVSSSWDQASGGLALDVRWNIMKPTMQRPVDKTLIQYIIGVPTSGYGLPSGSSWSDLETPVSTDLNIWQGMMYPSIEDDECLFIRVATMHDNNVNASGYQVAYYGSLEAPTIQSAIPNQSTHTIALTIANGCQNPDSKTAVVYRNPETGYTGVLGVLAHGSTTLNMVVPEWSESSGSVGVYTFTGDYEAQSVSGGVTVYSINAIQESDTTWSASTKTAANIIATKKDDESVLVEFGSSWSDATGAEISWSDRSDAWTSTEQPSVYDVTNNQQAFWIVSGLEKGKTWFFRVRMFYGDGDEKIYGDYSDMVAVDLSAPPEKPILTLSESIISRSGTLTASWQYSSADGTKMAYAEIAEKSGDTYFVIASSDVSSIELSAEELGWEVGNQYSLAVRVYSESNRQSAWSDVETVTIAEPLTCTIAQDSLVYDDVEINPETKTGSLVTLNGGDDTNVRDVTSLQVALEPVQDNDYDSVWAGGNGKNKLSYAYARGRDLTYFGVRQVINDDGSITLTGTNNSTESWSFFNYTFNAAVSTAMPFADYVGKSVVISCKNATSDIFMALDYFDENGAYTGLAAVIQDSTTVRTVTIPNNCYALRFYIGVKPSTTTNVTLYPMLGLASESDGTWKPWENIVPIIAPTTSKNLFDINAYHTSYADVTYKYTLTGLEPNEAYTLSTDDDKGTRSLSNLYFEGTSSATDGVFKGRPLTRRASVSGELNVYVRYSGGAIDLYSAVKAGTYYIQLEKGFVATKYRPYGENIALTHTGDNLIDDTLRNYSNIVTLPEGTWYAQAFIYATSEINTRLDYINENGVWTSIINSPLETPTFSTEGTYTFGWAYTAGSNPRTMTLHVTKPTTFRFKTQTLNDTRRLSLSRTKKNSLSEFVEFQKNETTFFDTLQTNLYDPANLQIGKAWNGNTDSARAIVWMPCSPNQEFTVTVEGGSFDQIYWFEKVSEDATSFVRNYAPPSYPYHVTTTATSQVMGIQFNKTAISASDFNGVKIRVVAGTYDGAIYGGTYDAVSGKVTITHGIVDGGNLTWNHWYSSLFWATISGKTANSITDIKCEAFETIKGTSGGYPDGILNQLGTGQLANAYIKDSTLSQDASGATDLKAKLSGHKIWYRLATPTDLSITPQSITLNEGTNNVWSEQGAVTVRIADAVESGYFLDELPLTVTVTGAGNEGDTTMKIVRAENYAMERPDGKDYNGYEGDLIVARNQAGEDQMSIDLSDLVGRFDDGAKYRIIATTQDQFGQSAEATKDFVVRWSHQAVIATGSAVIDGDIAKITPTKPDGALDSDMVDIYRLSADSPVLIYEGAEFGVTYVDPYPTIGEMGGYRLVLRTKNGDYITENDIPSWTDIQVGIDSMFQYIDFDGNKLPLKYNVEISESAEKIMEVTQYLGGSVQGDSLEGYRGSGTVNSVIPYDLDPADYLILRELKRYSGVCHVRTKTGSNYTAFVSVNDGSAYNSPGHGHNVGLTIQQFDDPVLDGMELTDWQVS